MQTLLIEKIGIYINIICWPEILCEFFVQTCPLSADEALLHFAICCVCCLYIHSLVHQLRSTQAARMTEGTSAFDGMNYGKC
jgi:hypothetical protein